MTYCIADIHGCFDEFLELLELINFSDNDTLYILGDIIDRGNKNIESLEYVYNKPNMIYLMGNHEDMMLKFYPGLGKKKDYHWLSQGGHKPLEEIDKAKRRPETKARWDELFNWIKERPLYMEVEVGGKLFFLSHAGLNCQKGDRSDIESLLAAQDPYDIFWSREVFYEAPGLPGRHCVFGHSATFTIRGNNDCSIWFDEVHKDKTCIDCGCVYSGALGALRLDDGAVFHVKSQKKRRGGRGELVVQEHGPIRF